MELYEEKKIEKKNDISKIIKIAIFVALSLMVVLMILLLVIPKPVQEIKISLTVDKKQVEIPETLCVINEETGEPFFSIKDLAGILKYSYYRGEYIDKYTEDNTKCYIESGEEMSSYILGSNVIYKAKSGASGRYEYYNIEEPVMVKNSKLYVNVEGIKIGFNVMLNYDKTTKKITIVTLPYLLETVITELKTKNEYTLNEKSFDNKKALLYDLIIVLKTGKFGVINPKGEVIIGNKYDDITFSENTREFFVKSEDKKGVLSLGGDTKIPLNYNEIQWLDTDLRLYYVKKDNYTGVLDRNGKILIHIEYNEIGIDSKLFPKNKIKNQMFLYDNCIPVKKEAKWGFYDKNGKLMIPIIYDKVGYVVSTTNEKSINNAVLIEDIDGIVLGITNDKKENKYGVVNSLGEVLIPCEFDRIYSVTSGAEDTYYLEKDGQTTTLDQYVLDHGLKSYKNNTLVKETKNEVIQLNSDNNIVNETNTIENIL